MKSLAYYITVRPYLDLSLISCFPYSYFLPASFLISFAFYFAYSAVSEADCFTFSAVSEADCFTFSAVSPATYLASYAFFSA